MISADTLELSENAMGDIIRFPQERMRLRKKPYWRAVDLLGKKPRGHAASRRGLRGRVLMAPGQVWVERYNQRLWVIRRMIKKRKRKGGPYPHDVTLVAYRGREERMLTEASLRQRMHVWEAYRAEQAHMAGKPSDPGKRDPHPSFEGGEGAEDAANGFPGLDEGGPID